MQKLHIIYIPGLGDRKVGGQRRAVQLWHWWGVEPELFQMNWGDKEPWAPKFKRLLARVDELTAQGKRVGLVGVSGGAAAAVTVYAARRSQIVGIVCIAGKINRPEVIGQRYRKSNPAFVTAAKYCAQALEGLSAGDRRHIMSRYAVLDGIVRKTDSRVLGVHNRVVPSIGHVPTIASQITLGAPSLLRFLKRQ